MGSPINHWDRPSVFGIAHQWDPLLITGISPQLMGYPINHWDQPSINGIPH